MHARKRLQKPVVAFLLAIALVALQGCTDILNIIPQETVQVHDYTNVTIKSGHYLIQEGTAGAPLISYEGSIGLGKGGSAEYPLDDTWIMGQFTDTPEGHAAAFDRLWFQIYHPGHFLFDLGCPCGSVYIALSHDHGPYPEEALEYRVEISNNGTNFTQLPTDTPIKLFRRGWSRAGENPLTGEVLSESEPSGQTEDWGVHWPDTLNDDWTARWDFPRPARFIRITGLNSSGFTEPEIDAVMGLSCEGEPNPLVRARVTGPTDDGVNDGINDGDTVDLDREVLGKIRVRYTGIDTPEITPGVECFANEATERNRQLVGNKTVWVELDERTVGGQGRLLAYVYTAPDLALDSMVNYKLLLEGYAKIYKVEENWRYVDAFRDAQLNAVFARQGMWGEGGCGDHPNADVVIAAIQYWSDDEFVVILNRGNNDVNLAGWTLSDEAGHAFTFSGDYDLQAWSPIIGLSLSTRVIHSGPGTNQTLDNDVNWTNNLIWEDAPGSKAFLRNAGGELVHAYEYKGF